MSYNKIKGMIIGHALGDSLGGPYECPPFPSCFTGIIHEPIKRCSRAYGHQKSSIGQVTDDTEMAISLIRIIGNGYSKESAIIEYMNWANNRYENIRGNSPFMGKNTRKLFVIGTKSTPNTKLFNNRFIKQFPNESIKENARSNGSLMRCYPLVVGDCYTMNTDVYLTNPSKFVLHITEIYIQALKYCLENRDKTFIKNNIEQNIKNPEIYSAFKDACDNKFRDVTLCRGYVLHAFYCAFLGLFQFSNYQDAINHIITMGDNKYGSIKGKGNRVGDTDTNAAITGALLGAYYGFESLQNHEITKYNIEIVLKCYSETEGDIKRPERYAMNSENLELFTDILFRLYSR